MTDSNRISEDDLFSALGISAHTSAASTANKNNDGRKSGSAASSDGSIHVPKEDSAKVSRDGTVELNTSASMMSHRVRNSRNSKEREEQLREKSIRSKQWREELERRQAKIDQAAVEAMDDATDAAAVADAAVRAEEVDGPDVDSQIYGSNKAHVSQAAMQTNATIPLRDANVATRAHMQNRTGGNTRTVAYNSRVGANQSIRSNLNTPASSTHPQAERKPFNNPWLANQQVQHQQVQQQLQHQQVRHQPAQQLTQQQVRQQIQQQHQSQQHQTQYQQAQQQQSQLSHNPQSEHSAASTHIDYASQNTYSKPDIHSAHTQALPNDQKSDQAFDLAEVADRENDIDKQGDGAIVKLDSSHRPARSSSKKDQLSESKKESPLGVVLIALAVLCVLIAVSLLTGLWDISNL